jgi:hypothetical protein
VSPRLSIVHGLALLADGAVSDKHATAVLFFYGLVNEINRGLDQAHGARHSSVELDEEAKRLDVKMMHLSQHDGPWDRARNVIVERMKATEPRWYR